MLCGSFLPFLGYHRRKSPFYLVRICPFSLVAFVLPCFFFRSSCPRLFQRFCGQCPFFTSFLKALSYLLAVHWSLPYPFKAFCPIFLYLRRNFTPYTFAPRLPRAHIHSCIGLPFSLLSFAVSASILSFQPCIGFIPSFAFLFD